MVGTMGVDLTVTERVALLRAVADPIRWRVLDELGAGGRCHCELEEALDVPANLLSHHLRVLREAGLVSTERRGRLVEYRLDEAGVRTLHAALPRTPRPSVPVFQRGEVTRR
jgi:ArsR family transcriptional regulator, arsenate/arsenite/antimonite-responsive transcriptional repressor